jgi:copper chaperone CopZ
MEGSTEGVSEVRTTTLGIGGMSCGTCVRHVSRALDGLSGVVHAEVDLAKNEATVEHLPAFTDEAALVAAVRDAGYPARVTGTREDVGRSSAPKGPVAICGCGCC